MKLTVTRIIVPTEPQTRRIRGAWEAHSLVTYLPGKDARGRSRRTLEAAITFLSSTEASPSRFYSRGRKLRVATKTSVEIQVFLKRLLDGLPQEALLTR